MLYYGGIFGGESYLMAVLWRCEQINQKAAESLADPQEYPNLFPDWELALETEVKYREQRYVVLIFESEWLDMVLSYCKINLNCAINLNKTVYLQACQILNLY